MGFVRIGNNGNKNQIEIRNVGSGLFNPNTASNWHYDIRYPLIAPRPGKLMNIYAPSIVKNGSTNWNVYFGGWDGITSPYDEISVANTQDDFSTFKPHSRVISRGIFAHVNNASVLNLDTNSWHMLFTTALDKNPQKPNRPAYATSNDGVQWRPDSGTFHSLITMSGYPNWESSDINGANVFFYQDGIFHLYFSDFNQLQPGVFHATSLNGINFSYKGVAFSQPSNGDKDWIVNDVKYIHGYYIMALHHNGRGTQFSIGEDLSKFPASKEGFTFLGEEDQRITSVGFVSDKLRLYGALYGACKAPSLDQNKIYAIWLQKQVLFKSASIIWGIGNATRAYGPDNAIILTNRNQESGKFSLYDTDKTTLLYESPEVIVREGDIWRYEP